MKIETKEERLQKIMQGEKDALALEPPSYSVQSQAVIDADVKIEFNQLKSSPEEPDNEVKMNRVIEYEVIITGIELRLAEWRTSPKGILILPNNKDVYISIVDDNKTKISLTGNRNGVASLQLILKDEDDESIVYYATPIQIRVTPSKPNPNNDCAASNCETFYDLLTIRSESMQWPSKWDNVSKSFVVHLQDKEGEDVSNKEVNLVYDVENSTLMSEPEIYNSDGEMSNASKTNKYGIANFKVKFKKSEPKQIAIFYAEVKSSEDPLESLKSRDYYVEMTTEKLPSPKVPATLNGILSYHAENYLR
ncbi:hypothetical protein [Shigella sp. FC1967]|uniref:hypothetical protein n=1 Tax=Shigella sp. FC1967 TaxID=1898041 RepID=UPI000A65BF5E|nr:hypothetical protein [Shigella sp. FC1967]